jgi:hypothetical protein
MLFPYTLAVQNMFLKIVIQTRLRVASICVEQRVPILDFADISGNLNIFGLDYDKTL